MLKISLRKTQNCKVIWILSDDQTILQVKQVILALSQDNREIFFVNLAPALQSYLV